MKRTVLILLMLLAPLLTGFSALGADYYVDTGGNDLNSGGLASPWRSIQHAVDAVGPGDTIHVRGGVYNEAIYFNRSGSAALGHITLKNYLDETPVLDGTGLTDEGLLHLENIAYVNIIGFQLRNLTTSKADTTPAGIWVSGTSHHLEIRDNVIHSIKNTADQGNAHGIAVYGESETASINNIVIDGNEIRDCLLGSSESLVLNGNVEDFVVSNNRIHDNDNIGIDFIGYEGVCSDESLDRARDGVCIGNTVYNIDASTNPAYKGEKSAGGIYVDGGTRITIERNIVHHCNIGIEIASEHQGKSSSHIIVKNNFVYQNHIMGIALGGYDTQRGSTQYCSIINNTCYQNDSDRDGNGELCLQYDVQQTDIKNNIFFCNDQNLFLSNPFTSNAGNTINYNIYHGSENGNPRWQWKKIFYSSFSSWRNATGNDGNSRYADPKLLNPASGNLHISSDSPAIDQGTAVTGLVNDIDDDKRPFGNGIDIGADEFTDASVLYVAAEEGCGGNWPCYQTPQEAIDAAGDGATIKIARGDHGGSIILNRSAALTLQGGWDASFKDQASDTTFIKAPKVNNGSLTFQMLTIRP